MPYYNILHLKHFLWQTLYGTIKVIWVKRNHHINTSYFYASKKCFLVNIKIEENELYLQYNEKRFYTRGTIRGILFWIKNRVRLFELHRREGGFIEILTQNAALFVSLL